MYFEETCAFCERELYEDNQEVVCAMCGGLCCQDCCYPSPLGDVCEDCELG